MVGGGGIARTYPLEDTYNTIQQLYINVCDDYCVVYSRLNHVGVCVSYISTLKLLDEISKMHLAPLYISMDKAGYAVQILG